MWSGGEMDDEQVVVKQGLDIGPIVLQLPDIAYTLISPKPGPKHDPDKCEGTGEVMRSGGDVDGQQVVVKQELDIGPVVLQPPDIAYTLMSSKSELKSDRNACHHEKQKACKTMESPECGKKYSSHIVNKCSSTSSGAESYDCTKRDKKPHSMDNIDRLGAGGRGQGRGRRGRGRGGTRGRQRGEGVAVPRVVRVVRAGRGRRVPDSAARILQYGLEPAFRTLLGPPGTEILPGGMPMILDEEWQARTTLRDLRPPPHNPNPPRPRTVTRELDVPLEQVIVGQEVDQVVVENVVMQLVTEEEQSPQYYLPSTPIPSQARCLMTETIARTPSNGGGGINGIASLECSGRSSLVIQRDDPTDARLDRASSALGLFVQEAVVGTFGSEQTQRLLVEGTEEPNMAGPLSSIINAVPASVSRVSADSQARAFSYTSSLNAMGDTSHTFSEWVAQGLESDSESSDGEELSEVDRLAAQRFDFVDSFSRTYSNRAELDARELDHAEMNEPLVESHILSQYEVIEEEVTSPEQRSFQWSSNFDSFTGEKEVFRMPNIGPTAPCTDPTQCFLNIWDEAIMEYIVDETNRYAQSMISLVDNSPGCRLHQWVPTNLKEMYTLFQIFILQSVMALGNEREYWYPAYSWLNTSFTRLMSYDRFILLKRVIHFVDNSTIVPGDKVAKIQPLVEHCNFKFQALYNLRQEIAIDESLTLWKGKLSFLQFIRTKAAKYGIKTYELCESKTGYLWHFYIYTGKDLNVTMHTEQGGMPPVLATTKIVLKLMDKLYDRGHVLYMDNFYNCPLLARILKSRGTDCVGTLRCNRKNVPRQVSALRKHDLCKGEVVAMHSSDVVVMVWRDSNKVNMISTFHHAGTAAEAKQAGRRFYKPTAVLDYNVNMGGVDLKDQRLSNFLMERLRNKKWYIKIFKRLLNTSLLNSYIIYCESMARVSSGPRPMTHRAFRYKVADGIHQRYRQHITQPMPMIPSLPSITTIGNRPLLSSNSHISLRMVGKPPDRAFVRRNCIVCKYHGSQRRTYWACSKCFVPLCTHPCFFHFHREQNLRLAENVETCIDIDTQAILEVGIRENPAHTPH